MITHHIQAIGPRSLKKVNPVLYKILSLKNPNRDCSLTNETYADM